MIEEEGNTPNSTTTMITNHDTFDDSPSLDILNNQAKEAFESQNSEASKQAHEQKSSVVHHKEKHNVFGEYVKSIGKI